MLFKKEKKLMEGRDARTTTTQPDKEFSICPEANSAESPRCVAAFVLNSDPTSLA
jgi:hypothetical protein